MGAGSEQVEVLVDLGADGGGEGLHGWQRGGVGLLSDGLEQQVHDLAEAALASGFSREGNGTAAGAKNELQVAELASRLAVRGGIDRDGEKLRVLGAIVPPKKRWRIPICVTAMTTVSPSMVKLVLRAAWP